MRPMILVLMVGALLLAFASTVALAAARYGTDGHDVLFGTHSADEIYGHGGDDYISAKDGRRDLVDCGPGRDWFNTDSFDVVRNCEVPAIT